MNQIKSILQLRILLFLLSTLCIVTMCETETSPYSTFKIISTLMGLHNNVLEDTTSTMDYNGTQYPISE